MDHSADPIRTGEGYGSLLKDSSRSGSASSDDPQRDPHSRFFESGANAGKRTLDELNKDSGHRDGGFQTQEFHGGPFAQRRPIDQVEEPNPKRRKSQNLMAGHAARKAELMYGLPIPIWRKILGFVPPVFLGRLLRVSQSIHTLLDPLGKAPAFGAAPAGQLFESEAIWTASRQRFAPGLPKNLPGKRDLEMWRLMRGNDCQICHEKKQLCTGSPPPDLWQAGPGFHNVRVLWPFGVRCCGSCLSSSCEQEFELLCSNAFPSFLLPALHSCFITETKNFVSARSLRDADRPSQPMQKYFYKRHVEQISNQFEDVKQYGQAYVQEWLKGLDSKRQAEARDIARWEQWEAKGGLKKVNARPAAKSTPSTRQSSNSTATTSKPDHADANSSLNGIALGMPARVASPPGLHALPQATPSSVPDQPNGLPQRPSLHIPSNLRPERNIKDINDAKAARRTEIEKRSMALEPPITPNILFHMSSFQAALQITTSLTDPAWELLKPRLLSQRSEAELRERERLEQSRTLMASLDDPSQHDSVNREASDRQWEAIQGPVRDMLGKYADEIIEGQWAGGEGLTKESRPNFAANVLIYCRRKYYEDAAQRDQSDSPSFLPSKLVLENMKWVFDHKIREHTEGSHRELFLCNGCEGNSKFYGFEAVIQHYAAKHTSSLSLGSVIVHWRAEWPEEPPFHPNPSSVRNGFYSLPKPVVSGAQHLPAMPAPSQGTPNPYALPFPTEPLSGTSASFPMSSYPDQASTYYAPSPAVFTPPTPFQPMAYPSQPGSQVPAGQYAASPHPTYGFQPPPTAAPGPGPGYQYPLGNPGSATFQQGYYQNGSVPQLSSASMDLYQRQMADMAKIAREVWFGIAGIKDMPQSVRIYIVIQHVVTRFEKLYTNEPSLSMFIDGLDHNPQMRPVRSLNGLACKACVANSQEQAFGSASQPHQLSDRRLFTLPHLLNHFKSAHLEQDRPNVDGMTGAEAPRFDWKRDMIELPDNRVIAEVGTASGMDMKKFELITTVFPDIFPASSPIVGTSQVMDSSISNKANRWQTSPKTQIGQISTNDHQGSNSEISSSRPYSSAGFISRSSPGTPEPAAEHEYDPNRPADFGKIIESHQVTRPMPSRSTAALDGVDERQNHSSGPEANNDDYYPSSHGRHEHHGAYSDLLLRHLSRLGKKAAFDSGTSTNSPRASSTRSMHGEPAQVSGPGSEGSTQQQTQYQTSKKVEDDEIDRFLDAVVPQHTRSVHRAQSHVSMPPTNTSQGPPRTPSSDHGYQPEVVTLSKGGTPEIRPANAENFERNGQVGSGISRDDSGYGSYGGGYYRTEPRPQIIYIREGDSGYPRAHSRQEHDRPGQITYLGSEADRGRQAGQPHYGSQNRASTPSNLLREQYQPSQGAYQQSTPPRPLYLEGGRYIVAERGNWQRGQEEYVRRPVEYIPVRREDYEAPRYYIARPLDSADLGARPQYVYESNVGRYPEERREAAQSGKAPPGYVEYRELR